MGEYTNLKWEIYVAKLWTSKDIPTTGSTP
jgi:hypothetical protein